MKREARLLLEKACDSMLLCIELFNRPHDRGRTSSTLILLNHAFEMLLKAALVHRGNRIRETKANQTIGFDTCVRRGLTVGDIKFLSEEQALLLQSINRLRDAAQHDLLEISEGQLYVSTQAGVTLFRDLLKAVFEQELSHYLPERVLPVSTSPPSDLSTLFDHEVAEIKKLLRPGKRRRLEAEARLRPLAILDAAISGDEGNPDTAALRRVADEVASGKSWQDIFKGSICYRDNDGSRSSGIVAPTYQERGCSNTACYGRGARRICRRRQTGERARLLQPRRKATCQAS